jgi:hypothetical protein
MDGQLRRLLLIFLLCPFAHGQILGPILFGGSTGGGGIVGTCGGVTGYQHTFTVDVPPQAGLTASSVSNYSMFFAGNAILKSSPNGGYVTTATAIDVIFCTTEDGTGTILPYELVPGTYNSVTGAMKMWVQVPTVFKATTHGKIYGMAGKPSATDLSCWPNEYSGTNSCGNAGNLWGAYQGVWHWGNSGTLSVVDSAGHFTSPTNNSVLANASCEVGTTQFGCAKFVSSGYLDTGSTISVTNFTLESWFQNQSTPQVFPMGNCNDASCTNGILMLTYSPSTCTAGTGSVCFAGGYHNGAANYYAKLSTHDFAGGSGGHTATWHHFFGTHVSGSANFSLCVDGAADSGTVQSGGTPPSDPSASTGHFQIGTTDSLGFAPYTGYMDETRMFASSFANCDQALLDYNNQSNPTSFYTVSTP